MADAEKASPHQVTQLLQQLGTGKRSALNELVPLVYAELRRIARRQLARERAGHTLDSVALVNEAFVNLVNQDELALQNRAHFFGVSANAMRRILVDYARARNADKRGGGAQPVSLDDVEPASPVAADTERLLALDAALDRLAVIDEEAVKIVEHRYFTGATEEEAARAIGISPATARRRWAFAKAWLQRELNEAVGP
jgi:RNA polymerase sigma factor (TIGR02999 family)